MKAIDASNSVTPKWELGFPEIPRGGRLLLLWVNSMLFVLVVAAFASGFASDPRQLYGIVALAVCEAFVLGVVYVWGSGKQRDIRSAHIIALSIHAVLGIYWLLVLHEGPSLYVLLTGYWFALVFRHHHLYQMHSVTAANRLELIIDTAGFFLITTYFFWWAVPMGDAVAASLQPFFDGWLFAAVLLRLYSLWFLERIETGTKNASARNIWILLICVVLLAVFIQHGLVKSLMAIFGAFGLLFTPLMYLVPGFHVSTPQNRIHRTTQPENNSTAANQIVYGNHTFAFHMVLYALLAGVLLLALYLLFRRRVAAVSMDDNDDDVRPTVVRHSLTDKEIFLPTQSALRLQVQAWMRLKLKRSEIRPTHTWRMMIAGEKEASEIAKIRDRYEQERYGYQRLQESSSPSIRQDSYSPDNVILPNE